MISKIIKSSSNKKKEKLIIANWKMAPQNLIEARKIFREIKKQIIKIKKMNVVICPPNVYLSDLSIKYNGKKIQFGAQDISWRTGEQNTGEIGADILKSFNVKHVIVGHSERREIGETNEIVSLKLIRSIDDGLIPILCVGEKQRDKEGKYLHFVRDQLIGSLAGIEPKDIEKVIIAYEPLFAIGSGHSAISANDLHQMILYIRKILSQIYNRKIAMNIKILYGGSVGIENCKEIVDQGEVDGLLIGRASLNPYLFTDILKVFFK